MPLAFDTFQEHPIELMKDKPKKFGPNPVLDEQQLTICSVAAMDIDKRAVADFCIGKAVSWPGGGKSNR